MDWSTLFKIALVVAVVLQLFQGLEWLYFKLLPVLRWVAPKLRLLMAAAVRLRIAFMDEFYEPDNVRLAKAERMVWLTIPGPGANQIFR